MIAVGRPLERLGRARAALPENVRTLGRVSFANDLASEFLYPIVPLFLTVTLGAPVAVLGVIEGVAEGIAVGFRGLAGWLSDRFGGGRRRWITAGYAASAVGRPLLAVAPGWPLVLGARVVDRLGKALRTAPRDALIRDSTVDGRVGASFGYHRAMDTAGAVVGPLVAVGVLAAGLSLRSALWLAVVPGFAALVLLRRVREVPRTSAVGASAPKGRLSLLPRSFWAVLAVWVVFSLGNSSDVFLILRARDLGLGATLVVLAYAAYNLVYAGLSWPLGALSDRLPRTLVLAGGLAVFALVYLGFAFAPGAWAIWPLFAVYGAYIAATEGVARAWVADHALAGAVGTAYGLFAAATGASLLVASSVGGLLWSEAGPRWTFLMGAVAATTALIPLLTVAARR